MRPVFPQRCRRIDHRFRIEPERHAALKQVDPLPEAFAGRADQLVQRRRGRALLGEPQVHHLLHRPARIAEVRQPDHAARALQRVKAAPDRGEDGLVGWCPARLRSSLGNRCQHFLRLAEEDPEQFAVDLGLVALRLLGLRGRLRRLSAGDARQRGLQRRIVARPAGVEQRDRVAHPALQRTVVDQLRIIAQLYQRLAQFAAQRGVVGRVAQRADQFTGALRAIGEQRFGGVRRRRLQRERTARLERDHYRRRRAPRFVQLGAEPPGGGVERETRTAATALLQSVDEKAQRTKTGGNQLAIVGRRRGLLLHEATHALGDAARRRCGVAVTEQLQRACHLVELLRVLRQIGTLRCIAKERVERLFGRAQAALGLGNEAGHRQALLRSVAQVAQPLRQFALERVAGQRLPQPSGHFARALVEFVLHPEATLEPLLGEEQRRRAFQRQRLGHRLRPRHQHPAGLDEGFDQGLQALARQCPDCRMQGRDRLRESVQVGPAARGHLLPGRLGAGQRLAGRTDRAYVDASEARHLEIDRHRALDLEGAQHLGQQRRRGRLREIDAGEREQRVLHQPLGHRRAVGDRAAQLQVHPGEQALAVDVEHDRAIVQRLEPGEGHLPEGRMPGTDLRAGNHVDRLVQRRDAGRVVRLAQHLEQAALELRTCRRQCRRVEHASLGVGNHQLCGDRHHEEVGRMHPLGAARLEQVAIIWKQVQGLLWLAEQHLVEVFDDRAERARDALDQFARQPQLPALDLIEQRLGLRAEQRHPRKVDQHQRAVRLVQRDARGAQRRQLVVGRIVAAAELLAQLRLAGSERIADLARAPRQRGEIGRFGGRVSVRVVHRVVSRAKALRRP